MAVTANQGVTTPESQTGNVALLLKEWRQIALASDIAPGKIDHYLLDRADVPEEVKALLREKMSSAGALPSEAADSHPLEVGEGAEVLRGGDKKTDARMMDTESGMSGEIGMLDAKSQIEKIKAEVLKSEAEGNEVSENTAHSEEQVEVNSEAGTIGQTVEKKEATASDGTQNSIGDISGKGAVQIAGYSPSSTIADNAETIATKGNVQDSRTWQAMLLQRFLEIWGSFKGLFSN